MTELPDLSEPVLRDVVSADAAAITEIYRPYVEETIISFEEVPPSVEEMSVRIGTLTDAGLPWIVATVDGVVKGYAYAAPWRVRVAYRHSVELSVYLERGWTGKGTGRKLYEALLQRLRADGKHLAIGGITLPNDASVGLHEKLGFRKVAHFSEVGFKFGQWRDVGYWQLEL